METRNSVCPRCRHLVEPGEQHPPCPIDEKIKLSNGRVLTYEEVRDALVAAAARHQELYGWEDDWDGHKG